MRRKWNKGDKFIIGTICIIILLGVLFFFLALNTGEKVDSNPIDDQRSVLWPLLVSIVITLLGSLITTYVFLKEALDRTVDEHPYYDVVISKYRNRTMRFLLGYSVLSIFIMGLVIILYGILYYKNMRSKVLIRVILILVYGACILVSLIFLWNCIDINKGLYKAAEKLLVEKERKLGQKKDELLKSDVKKIIRMQGYAENETVKWLQIQMDTAEHLIDKKKFINRFSEWEKLLMILVETGQGFLTERSVDQRIRTAILDGMKVFRNQDIESDDAKAYGWEKGAYQIIREYQGESALTEVGFCEIYTLLSEYRDLLQVQLETSVNSKENITAYVKNEGRDLADMFLAFILYMSTSIFRILPKIEVFFPAGRFEYADFYSTRFENSSFRASSFRKSVFFRCKLYNSNFGMAYFNECAFFSADSRNCAISNALILSSDFQEAIFENVDFTGTIMKNCDLRSTNFNDAILSNMEIYDTEFGCNSIVNSKIWNVKLFMNNADDVSFSNCDFSNSDMNNIQCCISNVPEQTYDVNAADSVSASYLRYLAMKKFDKRYWVEKDQETEQAGISEIISEFRTDADKFYKTELTSGHPQKIKKIPVWRRIKETAVLKMQESVFADTVMPDFGFYRTDLEQSIFKNTQMNEVQLLSVNLQGSIMNSANMRNSVLWAVNLQSSVLNEAILLKQSAYW